MSAYLNLRFAIGELERAQKQAEAQRRSYLVALVDADHEPSGLADAAIAYAEAANLEANCFERFKEAQIEALQDDMAANRRLWDEGTRAPSPTDDGSLPVVPGRPSRPVRRALSQSRGMER